MRSGGIKVKWVAGFLLWTGCTAAIAGWFGPSNYDECVIDRSKGIQTQTAQSAVIRSCNDDFPLPPLGKKPTPITSPTPTPEEVNQYNAQRNECLNAYQTRLAILERRVGHKIYDATPPDCGEEAVMPPPPPPKKTLWPQELKDSSKASCTQEMDKQTPKIAAQVVDYFCRCMVDESEREFGMEGYQAMVSAKISSTGSEADRQATGIFQDCVARTKKLQDIIEEDRRKAEAVRQQQTIQQEQTRLLKEATKQRATRGSPKSTAAQNCIIKPAMTDDDYRACGRLPPSSAKSKHAPWPTGPSNTGFPV